MSDAFLSRLVRWLPTITLGSVLLLAELGGIHPTPGAIIVVIAVQVLWVAVPKAAYLLADFISSRRSE